MKPLKSKLPQRMFAPPTYYGSNSSPLMYPHKPVKRVAGCYKFIVAKELWVLLHAQPERHGFIADKSRFGVRIRQKRDERKEDMLSIVISTASSP